MKAPGPARERRIRALQQRRKRPQDGGFLAEGVRVLEDLLASDLVLDFALGAPSLEDTERGRTLAARLAARTELVRVAEGTLNELAATDSPQGVIAVARAPKYDLDDVPVLASSLIVLLDAVQDPGNAGAVMRSAEAFGAAAAIALPGTVDLWNAKAVRAAAGALFRMPVLSAETDAVQQWLRGHEFTTFAADAGGTDVRTVQPGGRVALVVGNEGAGIGAQARALADHIVSIPMPGRAESLNVAVAAGVLMFALTERRTSP